MSKNWKRQLYHTQHDLRYVIFCFCFKIMYPQHSLFSSQFWWIVINVDPYFFSKQLKKNLQHRKPHGDRPFDFNVVTTSSQISINILNSGSFEVNVVTTFPQIHIQSFFYYHGTVDSLRTDLIYPSLVNSKKYHHFYHQVLNKPDINIAIIYSIPVSLPDINIVIIYSIPVSLPATKIEWNLVIW